MEGLKNPSDNLIRVKYSLELLYCLTYNKDPKPALDAMSQSQLFEKDLCEKINNKVEETILLPLECRNNNINSLHYNLFGY